MKYYLLNEIKLQKKRIPFNKKDQNFIIDKKMFEIIGKLIFIFGWVNNILITSISSISIAMCRGVL